jgi:hypothetical protein
MRFGFIIHFLWEVCKTQWYTKQARCRRFELYTKWHVYTHTTRLYPSKLEYVRSFYELCKKKVKQSHYRPWQVLRVPGGWDAQILRQSVHESGKVVSRTHRPPLPPECIPGTHYCYRLSRAQGHSAAGRIMSIKNSSVTPTGIHPATFRFVAQCLNHCATACPSLCKKRVLNFYIQWLRIEDIWKRPWIAEFP